MLQKKERKKWRCDIKRMKKHQQKSSSLFEELYICFTIQSFPTLKAFKYYLCKHKKDAFSMIR